MAGCEWTDGRIKKQVDATHSWERPIRRDLAALHREGEREMRGKTRDGDCFETTNAANFRLILAYLDIFLLSRKRFQSWTTSEVRL